MATYYWVGGTGTWDATTTTNWATSSGGTGGAGVPTSADSVTFDSASNATSYAVTIANGTGYPKCFNLTVSGPASGSATLSGSGQPVIYGNMTLSATGVIFTNAYLYFAATTPVTITTNGVSLGSTTVVIGYDISGTYVGGGTYTLGSALVCSNLLSDGGTFSTSSSNYNLTTNRINQISTLTPTLILNASTVNVGAEFIVGSGTVTAGTSTINFTGASGGTYTLQFGGQTYYNVILNNGNFSGVTYNITDTGTNTFNSFGFNSSSTAPSLNTLTLSGNITTGFLILNNTAAVDQTRRLNVFSDTPGTARTLTVSNGVSIGVVDFRDITFAGLFAPYSVTYSGDCGGNSGLTFPTAKTVYWNLAGTQNWSATGWATSSGGTPSAANFPLAQDTVVFDNTGSVTGTITVNLAWNIGTIDMSGRTSAMTLNTSTNTPTVYGSWTNGTGTTLSGTGILTFSNRATKTINSAGVSFTQPLSINAPNGGLQLLTSNLTTSSVVGINLIRGTINLNNLSLTAFQFNCNTSSTTTALAFGTTGAVNLTGSGSTVLQILFTTFTYTGTSQINLTYSGSTGTRSFNVNMGANSPTINVTAGSDIVNIASNSGFTVGGLNFTGFTGSLATSANPVTVYGSLTLGTGMTASGYTGTMTFAATSGFQAISTNGVTVAFPIVINAPGTTISVAGAFTSTSTWTISDSTSSLYLGGTFTVSTFTSASTGYQDTNSLVITGSGAAFTQSVTRSGGGTPSVTMTSASSKTFAGGTNSYGTLSQGGAGALTITGTNSFADIQTTSRPSTITFPAGATTTVSAFTASGTAGNLLTLQSSSPGSQFTLSKSSGTVQVGYLSIQDSNAIGGAQWRAGTTTTFVSNVSGWLLLDPPTQVRARINSSGVLQINSINGQFDETQTLTYAGGIPVAQRTSPTVLAVSGYFDEVNLVTKAAIIPYSVSFDQYGSSGINLPVNSSLTLSGDFTIECWVYQTNTNQKIIIGSNVNFLSGPNYQIQFNEGGTSGLTGLYDNGIVGWQTVTCPSPLNTWFHLAYVRIGTTITVYYNGVSQGTFTNSASYNFSNGAIGNLYTYDNGGWQSGRISNFRMVKGLGVYTGNFTVPTTLLTATQGSGTNIRDITNQTSVLTCQSNAFVDNSGNNLTLTSYADTTGTFANPLATIPTISNTGPIATSAVNPPAKRLNSNGVLQVSGYFDEVTLA